MTADLLLPVRTATELDAMREAGRVVARALQAVAAAAVPGVRLRELDDIAATASATPGRPRRSSATPPAARRRSPA